MSLNDYPEETRINEAVFRLISYLLVALMMASGVATLIRLIQRAAPEWQPGLIAVFGFAVALDRLYTYRRFKKITVLGAEWLAAYGSHWIVILVIAKLLTGLSAGLGPFLAELPLWRRDFAAYFLDIEFITTALIAVVLWLVCGYFAELLDEMGLNQALIARDVISAARSDQAPPRARLLNLVMTIGGVLVLITAAVRIDLRAMMDGNFAEMRIDLPPMSAGEASTLLYFLLGLALLSMTQFISLHTRWSLQHTPVSRQLAARWAQYSLIFLSGLTLVASLLPTRYSLGLLSVLSYLINILISLFVFIMQLIFGLLMALISLPFLLMGREPPVESAAPIMPTLPPPPASAPITPGVTFPWWELVKSIAFWAIFLGLIVFSFIQYLRQHEEVLAALHRLPGFRYLQQFLDWVRSLFRGVRAGMVQAIATGRERWQARRAQHSPGLGSPWIGFRRLNARQRVIFFYLAMIRRGEQRGLPRQEAQTPQEYAQTLDQAFPQVDAEIDSLTEAFVEARYSRHPVESAAVGLVKTYWERIRQALRRER